MPGPGSGLDWGEGRDLYGQDPSGYALGRPDYPERVYDLLANPCGLGPGFRVLEIGPGTGLVTRHLLQEGAEVVAVEADPRMATHLQRFLVHGALHVVDRSFEEADLGGARFDLAVAATSFHWVAQPLGWQKLRQFVRPGGWIAIWWMLFEDPLEPDNFSLAANSILGGSPSGILEPDLPPFQIDIPAREAELVTAGFVDVRGELIRSVGWLDARQARALYGTMAIVLRRPPGDQQQVLDQLEGLVLNGFGGRVERQFLTAIYLGRSP